MWTRGKSYGNVNQRITSQGRIREKRQSRGGGDLRSIKGGGGEGGDDLRDERVIGGCKLYMRQNR